MTFSSRQLLDTRPLILTHANCTDGCTCAALFYRHYGDQARYLAVDHAALDPVRFPERHHQFLQTVFQTVNSEVIMADLCLSKDFINGFLERGNRVVVLDHHASSKPTVDYYRKRLEQESLPLTLHFSDGNQACGSALTWSYLYPHLSLPLFIRLVDDGDRWANQYGQATKSLYAALNEHLRQPKDLSYRDYLDLIFNDEATEQKIGSGLALYTLFLKELDFYAKQSQVVLLGGHAGLWVEAPGHFKSELGHLLATQSGTFGVVVTQKPDMTQVSLRSEAPFDVTRLAGLFGGGGHPQAAAFRLNSFAEWIEISRTSS